MMNNNHPNNFSCDFKETLVAVLYGEATTAEERELNIHLENCTVCREESASFGIIRTSVADWRKADFDFLPTPQLILPHKSKETAAWQPEKLSWSGQLRDFFLPNNKSLQGAGAFAAFAVCFVIIAIFGYAVLSRYPVREVVNLPKTEPPAIVWNSPTLPPSPVAGNSPSGDKQIEKNSQTNDNALLKTAPKSSRTEVVGVTSVPQNLPERRRKNQNTPRNNLPKSVDSIPEAIESVDELEDDSLRLTNLLDDVTPSM